MFTPDTLKEVSFERAGKNAYRADEVDEFVTYAQRLVRQVRGEKEELESKILVLAEKIEEYRKDEDSLRAALLGAQRFGDNIVKESKNKAEVILRDANSKADRIVNDVTKQAEGYRLELSKLKTEVTAFKSQILSLYKKQVEMINLIPAVKEEPESEQSAQESEEAGQTAPKEPKQAEQEQV